MDRRSFIQSSAAALAGTAVPLFPMAAMAADEIVVGSIIDMSGGLDIYGKPMADCMTLAVEEQNAAGGLLGRKLKLATYDPQSNMQLYAQFAQQSALKDKSTVVMGGITVSSLPEDAREHCDSVVIGEGETLWPEVLRDFENGRLKPFYAQSPPGQFDLADAPMPRFA